MMPNESTGTARLGARIAPEALAVVPRAAEIQGRNVSDFVVAAAQEAAQRRIEETQILRLSVEDQRRFGEALLIRVGEQRLSHRASLQARPQGVFSVSRCASLSLSLRSGAGLHDSRRSARARRSVFRRSVGSRSSGREV
jgi:uncharacterized protein (DUF1778 family)